jgi:hypothetical protein
MEITKGLKTIQKNVETNLSSSLKLHQNTHEHLTQSIEKIILQKQYDTAYYKLPIVMKEIKSTPGIKPPQGLYYINRLGKKIYLKESQKQKWKNGQEIAGCIKGCSKNDIL